MVRMRGSGLFLGATALALVASLSISNGSGSAQTPGADQAGATPNTIECAIEPRTYDELVTLFAEATSAPVADSGEVVTVPVGQAADGRTVAAVTATIQEAVACLNAGEFGRFLALLTPHAITTAFSWLGEELGQGGFTETVLTETSPQDPPQAVVAIGAVTILADGRYTAVVIINDPTAGTASFTAMHLVLIQDGQRLLIDEVADFHQSE